MACGSLKSSKMLETQKLEAERQYWEQTKLEDSTKTSTLLIDTSHSEYMIELLPIGKFSYSAEKGFVGMAEKLVIKGKGNRRQLVKQEALTSRKLEQQQQGSETTRLNTKVQSSEKNRKAGLPIFWILLLAVAVLGLGYWLMRKWKVFRWI
jgi:hypothetical protein